MDLFRLVTSKSRVAANDTSETSGVKRKDVKRKYHLLPPLPPGEGWGEGELRAPLNTQASHHVFTF